MINATIRIPLFNARATDGTLLSVNRDHEAGPRVKKGDSLEFALTSAGGFALVTESPRGSGHNVINRAILPVVIPSNFVAGLDSLAIKLSTAVVTGIKQFINPASKISVTVERLNVDGTVSGIPGLLDPYLLTTAYSLPLPGVDPNDPDYVEQTFGIDGTHVAPGDELLVKVQVTLLVSDSIPTKVMICSAKLIAAVE
jgi:hypothetical protein